MLQMIRFPSAPTASRDFANLKVLIVDGNKRRRFALDSFLRTEGVMEVNQATNATEGLRESLHRRPDLIILDFDLQDINGVQFAITLRRSERPDRYARLIMLGNSDMQGVCGMRDCGIDEFLAKPVNPPDLLRALTSVALHGRDFIETPDYFGPDRRREPRESIETNGWPALLNALMVAAAA